MGPAIGSPTPTSSPSSPLKARAAPGQYLLAFRPDPGLALTIAPEHYHQFFDAGRLPNDNVLVTSRPVALESDMRNAFVQASTAA